MKLVVGLGNVGKEYQNTYHNIGFMVADKIASILGAEFTQNKCDANFTKAKHKGQTVIIAKPTTFMNASGESIAQFCKKFKIEVSDVLVICDDMDLPKGDVRFREHGSAGTHNGLRNIVECLNSEEFKRVRIGIKVPEQVDLREYVLSKIDADSATLINPAVEAAAQKVLEVL